MPQQASTLTTYKLALLKSRLSLNTCHKESFRVSYPQVLFFPPHPPPEEFPKLHCLPPKEEFCDMRIATWPLPTLKLPPAKALKPPSTLRNLPAPKRTALVDLLVFVTKLIVLEP